MMGFENYLLVTYVNFTKMRLCLGFHELNDNDAERFQHKGKLKNSISEEAVTNQESAFSQNSI